MEWQECHICLSLQVVALLVAEWLTQPSVLASSLVLTCCSFKASTCTILRLPTHAWRTTPSPAAVFWATMSPAVPDRTDTLTSQGQLNLANFNHHWTFPWGG